MMKTKILDTLNIKYANYSAVKLPLLPVLIYEKAELCPLGVLNSNKSPFKQYKMTNHICLI